MSKITFNLDYNGVRENILNADFVLDECVRVATATADAEFGGDYHMITYNDRQRAHAIAVPDAQEGESK